SANQGETASHSPSTKVAQSCQRRISVIGTFIRASSFDRDRGSAVLPCAVTQARGPSRYATTGRADRRRLGTRRTRARWCRGAGGTWTGVARSTKGALGMVWIDAHMDAHTPKTSHTGRLHGMPLAWLLGQDDDPLYGLGTGVLEPENVVLIGVRSYEPEERERLERLGVRVIYMAEVEKRGIDAVLEEALAVATRG